MSDVMDLDRGSVLDAFARPSEGAGLPATVPAGMFAAPAERVFGAQQVAVKRDESAILHKLATLAAAVGDDWGYRFPVKRKDGGQDFIEGASIKLANDLARIYGNCEVDTRVMDLGDSWLFYARFTDFETGYSLTRPFQQRKSQRSMKGDADRALDIAFQIGASKAIRNVVCNALQTFADFAFAESKRAIVTKVGKNLAQYRERVVTRLAEMKIEQARVERAVGRSAKDWLAPDIARIIRELQAIGDGMATADETYPPLAPTEPPPADAAAAGTAALDEFGDGSAGGEKHSAQARGATAAQAASADRRGKEAPADATPPATDEGDAVASSGDEGGAPTAPSPTTLEPLDVARRRARENHARGMARKAVPGEYREKGREAEMEAYLGEFDRLVRQVEGEA